MGFLGHGGPDTLLARHGDVADFARVLAERGDEIACVILEPVMGAAGLAAAAPGALGGDRRRPPDGPARCSWPTRSSPCACTRAARSSCTACEPDLTAMGKIIGGGFPVGAVGGRPSTRGHRSPAAPGGALRARSTATR